MTYVFRFLGSLWPIYRTARCGCVVRIRFAKHTFDRTNCDYAPVQTGRRHR